MQEHTFPAAGELFRGPALKTLLRQVGKNLPCLIPSLTTSTWLLDEDAAQTIELNLLQVCHYKISDNATEDEVRCPGSGGGGGAFSSSGYVREEEGEGGSESVCMRG